MRSTLMRGQARRWTVALAVLVVVGGVARAQEADPETIAAQKVERAREILAEMKVASEERVYALGSQLRRVAGDDDPVLRVVAEGMQSAKPAVVLACAGIVIPDYADVGPLVAIINQAGSHAPWAAGIIGRLGERRDIKVLRDLLADEGKPAAVRRAAATGLLQYRASEKAAVALLTRAVEEGPAAVTREAALVLADGGHVQRVKRILAAIATEPTVDGATARAYLRLAPLRSRKVAREVDLSTIVDEVVRMVQQYYPHAKAPDGTTDIDHTYLRDAAARGMIRHLDPFSSFMTLDDFRKREEQMRGSYGGIGAYVQMRPYRGDSGPEPRDALTITAPIYQRWDGTLAPAYLAGIRSGDQVVRCQVPEHPDGPVELLGKTLQECVALLKGPPGTEVVVWVRSHGSDALRRVTLERATIEIDTSPGELMPGDIGYVRILRFDNKTGRKDLAKRLRKMRDAGAKALLIDLRNNPGGSLVEVVQCADWFLEKGAMVTTVKGRHENWKDEKYVAKGDPVWTRPIVILTNEESASGAELLSGALRDHGVATVIGNISDEKPTGATFGKGSGQTFIPLESDAVEEGGRRMPSRIVRLTVFKYYLPKGDSVHKVGMVPDIALKLPEYPEWQFEAAQALRQSQSVARYVYDLVAQAQRDPALKQRLRRLADFDDFKTDGYPGFAEWVATLDTRLDREALRRLVRGELRAQLADDRAREFLFDFQEDQHLQRGIVELLRTMGADLSAVAEYQHFVRRTFVEMAPRKGETEPSPK